MERTTRAMFDEIVKRIGIIESRLPGYWNPAEHVGTFQEGSRGNKAGRKNETAEIAVYANQLRLEKNTWKQVWIACKRKWHGSKHVKNAEQVRAIWRRHYQANRVHSQKVVQLPSFPCILPRSRKQR